VLDQGGAKEFSRVPKFSRSTNLKLQILMWPVKAISAVDGYRVSAVDGHLVAAEINDSISFLLH